MIKVTTMDIPVTEIGFTGVAIFWILQQLLDRKIEKKEKGAWDKKSHDEICGYRLAAIQKDIKEILKQSKRRREDNGHS